MKRHVGCKLNKEGMDHTCGRWNFLHTETSHLQGKAAFYPNWWGISGEKQRLLWDFTWRPRWDWNTSKQIYMDGFGLNYCISTHAERLTVPLFSSFGFSGSDEMNVLLVILLNRSLQSESSINRQVDSKNRIFRDWFLVVSLTEVNSSLCLPSAGNLWEPPVHCWRSQ